MKPVHVEFGDICEGGSDLTIIPCSGKKKKEEDPRIQARIDSFGLKTPYDMPDKFGYGRVSDLML